MWDCKVLCFIDLKRRLQRYIWSDFSLGLCCKDKEGGAPEQQFFPFMERQVGRPESTSQVAPLRWYRSVTQQAWKEQTLHIPSLLTGSREITSETLEEDIWQKCHCFLVALSHSRWFIHTVWFMVGTWDGVLSVWSLKSWRLRSKGQSQECSTPV